MLLCMAMVFTMLPAQAFAMETGTQTPSEVLPETETAAEVTVPVEAEIEPAEQSVEQETEPVPETEPSEEAVPTETAAAPVEEKAEPVQDAAPEHEPVAEETQQEPAVEPVYVEGPGFDSEELYEGYLNKLFLGDEGISTFGILARDRLSAADKYLYDGLKAGVLVIANGETASTDVWVDLSYGGYDTDDVDWRLVLDALYHDCPYEFYWYDGAWVYDWDYALRFAIIPAPNYQPYGFDEENPTINTTKTRQAAAAAANAHSIVSQYASCSDYDKLAAYADKICSLVEYDDYAADNDTWDTNINPWTLVNVFDNDPSTNVVCEGYSEAFQYLCDLSDFNEDVECYSPTGANHKWNIVRINGVSYLMDVTHCDDGSVATRGPKFLGGGSGSVSDGYYIGDFYYWYYEETIALWGSGSNSILKLSPTAYVPGSSPNPGGSTYSVTYDANGGHGAPENQTKNQGVSLVLEAGVPGRFGYNFTGWATSSTATTATYQPGDVYSRDESVTLYAVWKAPSVLNSSLDGYLTSADIRYSRSGMFIRFQPERSGNYRIYGNSSQDTVGFLYDGSGNEIMHDDDAAGGLQFQLDFAYDRNKTYYLYVQFYGSDKGNLQYGVSRGFTITYDANGGTDAPENGVRYYGFDATLSTDVPSRAGYTFLGWADSPTATTAMYQPGDTFGTNTDVTLYAVWRTDAYTVSYDANGGTGAPASQVKIQGTPLTLTTEIPDRTGYRFLGWATSASAATATYLPGGTYSNESDVTLYAVWTPAAGISSTVTNSTYSPDITFPNAYMLYTFTPAVSSKFRFESTGTTDTMIYIYDADGELLAQNDDGGENRNFLLTYAFTGGTEYYIKLKLYSSNIGEIRFTVKRVYNVSYDANGGTGDLAPQDKIHGIDLTLSEDVPERADYQFLGWATSPSATTADYQPGASYAGNADVTLYAVWQSDDHTVHYDANGGTGGPEDQIKYSGTDLVVSWTIPNRFGYNFAGWATSSSAATADYLPGDYYSDEADLTLYAVWESPEVMEGSYLQRTRTANLVYPGVGEYFIFTPGENGNYRVYGTADQDSRVYLYDSHGNLIGDDDDGGVDRQFMLDFAYEQDEPLYIYVRFFGNTATGDLGFGVVRGLTVTYDANGGTGAPDSTLCYYDFEIGLSETVPTREGYTFLGWSFSSTATTATYAPGDSFTTNIDRTLYAVWEFEECINHNFVNYVCEHCGLIGGDCGDSLTWTLVDGLLTVSGTGEMDTWYSAPSVPWWNWKDEIQTAVIGEGVTDLGDMAFYTCINLTDVTLPDSLTAIGEDAFTDCWNLTTVDIPDGVTHIGGSAFSECSGLTSIEIPAGVTTIGEYTFYECTSLSSVTLHEGLTAIESYGFYGCENLTGIILPEGLTRIGYQAFSGCEKLSNMELPDSLISIGVGAFQYCSMSSIVLPEKLTSIGDRAFEFCTSLTGITIPASVTTIGGGAFDWCTGMETITFEGNAPEIGTGAFQYVTATAYYPANNPTWTADVMQNYGGTITWVPVGGVENRVYLNSEEFDGLTTVWIDGVEYAVTIDGSSCYVDLPDGDAKTMTTYTYHAGSASDVHSQYPVGMKVWTLTNVNGVYSTAYQEDFDNILQYSGMSIRVMGKKGIRMITSMEQEKKNALVSGGLAGYTLKEYGTAIAWASQLGSTKPLTLGQSYVKSNYAYKRGVADPVYRTDGSLMQYTNVLVNFSNDQCRNDIAMRSYMVLEDAQGNEITLYGGIVYRSIGYIAYQNRNSFEPGTDEYEYVWEIIHYVYGSIYDDEYDKVWTDPIM